MLSNTIADKANSVYIAEPDTYIAKTRFNLYAVYNPKTGSIAACNIIASKILTSLIKFGYTDKFYKTLRFIPKDSIDATLRNFAKSKIVSLNSLENTVEKTSDLMGVWIHLTNQCNLRCSYCYVHKNNRTMDWETLKKTVDKAFDTAQKHNFKEISFKFTGGEITLLEELLIQGVDYILEQEKARHKKVRILLLSNGVRITDNMIERLKLDNVHYLTSVDGIGEYHDVQRFFGNKKGSFKYVDKTLERLFQENIRPTVNVTITRHNLENLDKVTKYLLDKGAYLSLNLFRENTCTKGEELKMSDKEIIKAFKKAIKVIKKNPPDYPISSYMIDRIALTNPRLYPCWVNNNYLVVNEDGKISRCQMELALKVSDIDSEDPLEDLKKNKKGIQNVSVEEKETCKDCIWRYACTGGCPVIAKSQPNGGYNKKSPYCEVYKAIIPELIKLEAYRITKYSGNEYCNRMDLYA